MSSKRVKLLGEYQTKDRYMLGMFLTSFLTLSFKLTAAIISNSLTIFTDLLRNMGETFAYFMTWLTVHRIAKGKALAYEYGYGKLENAAGLLVAGILVLSLGVALAGAVERLRHPVIAHRVELGFFVALFAIAVNSVMWGRHRRRTRQEASPIMESQWHLFRSKTMANACVAGALGLSVAFEDEYAWAIYIDPVASLVVCGFLVASIYHVAASNAPDLLDRALDESLQLVILQELAAYYDEYVHFHGVRSRRSGRTVYIDLFLEFDGTRTMAEVQKSIDAMRTGLERKIPGSHVVISPTTSRVV
jgi:cation diffusion facilitator family transporter